MSVIRTALQPWLLLLSLLVLPLAGVQAQNIFWDDPAAVARDNARFPQAGGSENLQVAVWQEVTGSGELPAYSLTLAVRNAATGQWDTRRAVIGPIVLPGQEASLFSLAVTPDNQIWIAVLTSSGQVDLYQSTDRGQNFAVKKTFKAVAETPAAGQTARPAPVLLTPRLFVKADGRPILFLTEGREDANGRSNFRISASAWDGSAWSALIGVTEEPDRPLNFLPSFASFAGVDYLAWQSAISTADGRFYQIFLKTSRDGGKTWGTALRLTTMREPDRDADKTDNQRPFLATFQNRLWMTWERKNLNGAPQVYTASFSPLGIYQNDLEAISDQGFNAVSPQFFQYRGNLFLNWFDNTRGSYGLYLKSRGKIDWQDEPFPQMDGDSTFGRPVPTATDLYFFWENRLNNRSSVVILQPDKRADPPAILPQNWTAGERFNLGRYYFTLADPRDPSGIKGFNYLWTQNPDQEVPKTVKFSNRNRVVSDELKGEGLWYLKAVFADGAGNWSAPATLSFYLDETPPAPMRIVQPALDDKGYLTSNTGELTWNPSSDDTEGYYWGLNYLGPLDQNFDFDKLVIPSPTKGSQVRNPVVRFNNLENGWWALAVRTVDRAGNVGEPFNYFFRLNKFKADTRITRVSGRQDNFGRVILSIEGRGFAMDGDLTEVYIDRDGLPPYDALLERRQFRVASDRLVDNMLVEGLQPGTYRVGVNHPVRGTVFSGLVLRVEETGTVKFGDYSNLDQEIWTFPAALTVFVSASAIGFWLIFAFLLAVIVLSAGRVAVFAGEIAREKRQAKLIFTPGQLRRPDGAKAGTMQKKGLSLGWKFRISILVLTTAVILMLALTLGFFITQNSQRSLGQGLRQQAEVLLDSQVTRAANILQKLGTEAFDPVELRLIPTQIQALEDARWALITGKSKNAGTPGFDFIWGGPTDRTTAAALKISNFNQGLDRFADDLTTQLGQIETEINSAAQAKIGDLMAKSGELKKRRSELLAGGQFEAATALAPQLDETDKAIKEELRALAGKTTGSWPTFNPDRISADVKTYTFYQPILYLEPGDTTVFKGLVRLNISVETILKDIEQSRLGLIQLTLLVALVALLLGLVGAVILANITVNPIRRLVTAVERIRDEEDKSKLKDFEIKVTSRDELAQLADTINDMSHGLAKAAEAAKELTVGKDIQKQFVPLQLNAKGAKTTIGIEDAGKARFFGYYEGAKSVSGDYFTYMKLDADHYAIIKCDVSGKGVPAALIMVQVATVFMTYFRNWSTRTGKDRLDVQSVVYQINDIVASMGYKGRFAAMMVGLMNLKTGSAILCHAGDNLVHIYRQNELRFETIELAKAPATGVFDNDMVGGAYKQVEFKLKPGDTLFMYTDGIEESKRKFRGPDFQVIAFKDPNDPSTRMGIDENFTFINERGREEIGTSVDNEDIGPERVQAVIEAIYSKGKFAVEKLHNPQPERPLTFDFSTCEGVVDEVILGLAAVDRVWRLVPDPKAVAEKHRIRLDIVVREFLEKHFDQFDEYFRRRPMVKRPKTEAEMQEERKKLPPDKQAEAKIDPEVIVDHGCPVTDPEKPEYEYWEGLFEDDQFDDLTLLAVQMK